MKHHKYHQHCWSESTSAEPTDWDGIVIVAGCVAFVLGTIALLAYLR